MKELRKGYVEDDEKMKEKAKAKINSIIEQQKRDDQICQQKQDAILREISEKFIRRS